MRNIALQDHFPALIPMLTTIDVQSLNGSVGSNRDTVADCQIEANDDYAAITTWLSDYETSLKTYTQYRREAERLVLWCLVERHKPFSSLHRDDFVAYRDFLSDPRPYEKWCHPHNSPNTRRGTPGWRPFHGPLSASSITAAFAALNSLFQYLTFAGYLKRNPLQLLRAKTRSSQTQEAKQLVVIDRIFSDRQWTLLHQTLEALAEKTHEQRLDKSRLRFLIYCLYYLSLRVNDIARKPWSSFRCIDEKWWFCPLGKGNKSAALPVSEQLLSAIQEYRTTQRLSRLPDPNDNSPIIVSWRNADGIGIRQINRLLKQLSLATLATIDHPSEDDVLKFSKFSSHWIRHMSGTNFRRFGLSLEKRMALMRHSKVETTLQYDHLHDNDLHDATNQLKLHVDPTITVLAK